MAGSVRTGYRTFALINRALQHSAYSSWDEAWEAYRDRWLWAAEGDVQTAANDLP